VHGTALHEEPLDGIERRELVVALRQRARLGLDAEEPRDEILDVRRQRDQEVGFLPRLELREVAPRRQQARVQAGVGFLLQESEEGGVDTQEALALVQVGESDAES